MKKIFIAVGVILLIVLVGAGYWVYRVESQGIDVIKVLSAKDIAPIDDSDLRLPVVVVADKDNAYFDLIKLNKVMYYPEDKKQIIADMVAGKAWDQKLAQELISKNAEAFKYFADAEGKPRYQNPLSANPKDINFEMKLPSLNSFRNMALLSVVRSIYFSKQGKDKEAIKEALRPVTIGQKIQNSQATLIEYLVALAMKGIGFQATQKTLVTSKLKSEDLKKYTQELNQYYKNEEGLAAALKVEYHSSTSALDLIAVGLSVRDQETLGLVGKSLGVLPNWGIDYYFQLNKTKLLFANFLRSQIGDVNRSCRDAHGFSTKKLDVSSFEEVKKVENAIGIILSDVAAEGLGATLAKKCREDTLVGATQTLFAIKAFKNDTKKYPIVLSELVPKYLDVVPEDPFDGKPLKYSPIKKIIYSVGEDKVDSGGVMSDDIKKTPDIVYSIGF